MADTGWHSPGTVVEDPHDIGQKPWTDENNAKASDNAYAYTVGGRTGGRSHWLKCTNFSMGVPAGATIDGIYVSCERKASVASAMNDLDVKIVKAGSYGSEDKGTPTPWPTADASAMYGSTVDKWNETWTAAQINASNFGVGFSATMDAGCTGYIDHVQIKVYYTAAPAGTNMKINISDVFKEASEIKINIGDSWKTATAIYQNIGDTWKTVFE